MRSPTSRINIGLASIPPTKEVLASLIFSASDVIEKQFPSWTVDAKHIAIAIGKFESYLGGAGSFAPDGIPSWNWGAVRARPDTDSFAFSNGQRWAKFDSMTDGFLYWKKIMPNAALNAMQKGDAKEVADAMFAAHYFGPEEYKTYESAIVAQSKQVALTLDEKNNVFGASTKKIEETNSGNGIIAVAAGLTTAGLIWYASKA